MLPWGRVVAFRAESGRGRFPLEVRHDLSSRGPGAAASLQSIPSSSRARASSRLPDRLPRAAQASLIGEKQVLTGKAKFGIFGDGKEVAQLALARAFRHGDFRSGYYRDQTFMFALGPADARGVLRPALRQRRRRRRALLGRPLDDRALRHAPARRRTAASTTSPQRVQLLGRRLADRLADAAPGRPGLGLEALPRAARAAARLTAVLTQRRRDRLRHDRQRELRRGHVLGVGQRRPACSASRCSSRSGTTATASRCPTSSRSPRATSRSVLSGFQRAPASAPGLRPLHRQGLGLPGAVRDLPERRRRSCAREHVPAIVHVTEVTQPQGHSTSGSHERYKTRGAAGWEEEFDGLRKMREWIIAQGIATAAELDALEKEDRPARARGAASAPGRRSSSRSRRSARRSSR